MRSTIIDTIDQPGRADASEGLEFFEALPVERDFSALGDVDRYHALPGDWVVGLADITGSTKAIAEGRYKAVNTVAAAVIAAIANSVGDRSFPFVFAGDGATFALPPDLADIGREALQAVSRWAEESFGFQLRIAMVSVTALRELGRDVRVARFAASETVSYAMFAGGGVAFAEAAMKRGEFLVEPAVFGAPGPKLMGLSCRFAAIPARNGVILSVIILPREDLGTDGYQELVTAVLQLVDETDASGRPVPEEGPVYRWPSAGFMIEAKTDAAHTGRPLWLSFLSVGLRSLLAHLSLISGVRVGAFDPARYRAELVRNTDFRKFDDGLRLTIDCSSQTADRIAGLIADAQAKGLVEAGLHRQEAALMTCFVPTASRSDHVHFIDGAMGGYAVAAATAFRDRRGAGAAI